MDFVNALAKAGAMNYASSKIVSIDGTAMTLAIDNAGVFNISKADSVTAVNTIDKVESRM